jgi:DNA repair exonuclease SbcCD ATPase subunit
MLAKEMNVKPTDKFKIDMSMLEREITTLLDSIPELSEDESLKQDMLEGSTDLIEFSDELIQEIYIIQGYINSLKDNKDRISKRIESFEKKRNFYRTLIHRLMETAKTRKLVTPNGTISISLKPFAVEIVEEELIPDEFMRIKKEPNKTLIGEKLKSGQQIPGARLSNGGETLTIR